MARGDRVIAISQHIAGLIEARHGTNPALIRVIPRGVDPAVFNPEGIAPDRMARLLHAWRLPDGAPVVMLPARLTRWKGQGVLLDAMARLGHPDAVAVLVGEGRPAYARELERRAHALGIADRVRLAGHCEDMPAALMLADVAVSASTDPEGFGRAVIEAQAMGVPTVVSDHGGAAETVEHLVTGWRVPPGDPDALAVALDHALGHGVGGPRGLGRTLPCQRPGPLHDGRDASGDARRLPRAAMNILVIKLGALGDVVLAFQPFADIRAHHPDARITLLTTAPFGFLAASPWFDAVLIDRRPALVAPARRAGAAAGPAGVRPGVRPADQRPLVPLPSRWRAVPPWSGIARGASLRHTHPGRNAMHTKDRQRDQLAVAGVPPGPAADLGWLTRDAPAVERPFALLVPGAAMHRPGKRWPAESFGTLAGMLAARGIRPVVVGARQDAPWAAIIGLACPGALDLTGRTTLPELAGLAARAQLAVGNDTGPMHLAAAVGCPSVVLFGADSDPALTAPRGPAVTVLRVNHLADLPVDRVAASLP